MLENLPLLWEIETRLSIPFWKRKSVHLTGVLILFVVGLIIADLFGYIPDTH